MSARVLNPAMMSDLSCRGGSGGGGSRIAPSRTALARVRRDLFGPVDHESARAFAERELRAQSLMDTERWGFDFQLDKPRENERYEWAVVTTQEIVPEAYALRGMPYLRNNSAGSSRNISEIVESGSVTITKRKRVVSVTDTIPVSPLATTPLSVARKAERTPPQEPRVPDIGESTTIVSDDVSTEETNRRDKRRKVKEPPTTPVLSTSARKQQTSITGKHLFLCLFYALKVWWSVVYSFRK